MPTAGRGIVRRPAAGIGLFPLGAVSAHAAQQSVGRLRTALRQGGIAGLARVPPIAHRRVHISRSRRHRPFGEERIEGRSVHRPTGGASSPLGERHILRRRQHIAHRRVHIPRSRRHGQVGGRYRPYGSIQILRSRRHRPLSARHRPTRGTSSPTRGGRISRRRGRLDQFAVCVERK